MTRWKTSIAAKLLLATGAAAFLIFVAAALLTALDSRRMAERQATDTLRRVAMARARTIAVWFDARRTSVEVMNEDVARLPAGPAMLSAFRHQALVRNFSGTYFGGTDGRFWYPMRRTMAPGYDPRARPWYRQAVRAGHTVITPPYFDDSLHQLVVTIATPLVVAGHLRGVTGADFSIGALLAMLGNDEVEGAKTFITDEGGRLLVHPDRRLIGRPLANAFDGTAPTLGGVSDVTSRGARQFVVMTRIDGLPGAHWLIGVALDRRAVLADGSQAQWRAALVVAIVTLACMITTWLLLERLVLRPIRAITTLMQDVAAGRLDASLTIPLSTDEIGTMIAAVGAFRDASRRLAELVAADADRLTRDAATRGRMLAELRGAFGSVVDAAVAGDFSLRVADRFVDPELDALARSVNLLVETADRGLAESGQVLSALARTDLTQRVRGDHRGAFADLKNNINAVADRLSAVVGELAQTSHRMRDATASLANEAGSLSRRTTEQDAALSETAMAVRRLNAGLDSGSRRMHAAGSRAADASALASEGSRAMAEAMTAMDRLHRTSGKVSGVITLIDTIASQTALLALNATIEAARAGGAGKGFAVVAGEVKRLAGQAANASSEASRLIIEAGSDVEQSVALIDTVSSRLAALMTAVDDNHGHLEALSRASVEQTRVITEISVASDRLDGVARANATLVTALHVASEQTQVHASTIDTIVGRFVVNG